MANEKILFEYPVVQGKFQMLKVEDNNSKTLIMKFFRTGKVNVSGNVQFSKEHIYWEISKDKKQKIITIVRPLFFLHWPKISGTASDSMIKTLKGLSDFEMLELGKESKYVNKLDDIFTNAWLDLNGKKVTLNYYGFSTKFVASSSTNKEVVNILSEELGLKIVQVS